MSGFDTFLFFLIMLAAFAGSIYYIKSKKKKGSDGSFHKSSETTKNK
jgi:hypothetical protein